MNALSAASTLALIPTQLGFELFADPRDYVSTLLLRDQIYEAPETDLVTHIVRAGDICIDAGCQIGYYTCLFAKLVGEKGFVYAFDANPHACISTRRNLVLNGLSRVEVIHSALANSDGLLTFHISTDDQTGLSSLGKINNSKEVISVPSLRLGKFFEDKRVGGVRLLKVDVEGAEEALIRGLEPFLSACAIDYILMECFDERLNLLQTSTENLAAILQSAGYIAWAYGVEAPRWAPATEVRSRGDCNYLFVSPLVSSNDVPPVSLAGALNWMRDRKCEALGELDTVKRRSEAELGKLNDEIAMLQAGIAKSHADIDWLLESIKAHEWESAQLLLSKRQCEALLTQIQVSAGWRMLNLWRRWRDRLAPQHSWYRRLYDRMLTSFRSNSCMA